MLTAAEAKNLTKQGMGDAVTKVMAILQQRADRAVRSACAGGYNLTTFNVECEERLAGELVIVAACWFESLGYGSSAEKCMEHGVDDEVGYNGNVCFTVSWK